ncbi:hypothetical protein AVEN_82073-1, partial [Araneus ventricosus]
MIGSLANDFKMVKNEVKFLQGDIKNFKEERHSLLLQIQEKNRLVENSKNNNNSLVKMKSYYDKKKSEPSNDCLCTTTGAHVRLKAWRSWDEDDDDSSENSDDEPGMQRPKRNC